MKAARCMASWKSTRYQEGKKQGGWAEPGWENSTVEVENERKCPLQVAGNFHFAPGKSFQQSHVHGEWSRTSRVSSCRVPSWQVGVPLARPVFFSFEPE